MTRYTFLCLLIFVASLEATATAEPALSDNLAKYTEKIRNYLCEREICLNKIPPVFVETTDNYHGYTTKDNSRLSISPLLDNVNLQLNLVHELIHVYRNQFNSNEEDWLQEGVAKFIEYQYSTVWPISYVEKLKLNLTINLGEIASDGITKNFALNGYGYPSAFFVVLYLHNHFGGDSLIKKILNSKKSGWDNVINSIQELALSGELKIPINLINKESILRHFAVSLWINNQYHAKYALFLLDRNFEALSELKQFNFPGPITNHKSGDLIQFSDKYQNSTANEVYSIISYNPFVIKKSEENDQALVYIYLTYQKMTP